MKSRGVPSERLSAMLAERARDFSSFKPESTRRALHLSLNKPVLFESHGLRLSLVIGEAS